MTKDIEIRGTKAARLIEVIRTIALKGNGTFENPYREVAQYWTKEGRLIAEEPAENIRCCSQGIEPV